MESKIDKFIENGISFLAREQLEDGCFVSLSSSKPCDFKRAKKYRSTFPISLILSALKYAEVRPPQQTCGGRTSALVSKSLDFLLDQKSENWSFNYWTRDAKENKTLPYPDDLDDTFCALSAIHKHKPETIDGEALAKIISILTFTEKEEGGPYRTWLAPEDSDEVWLDVDLAVNSNVAYFLSLQDISLPKLDKYIEKHIDEADYTSPYYPSPYPIAYFISRFYKGKKKNKIKDFLFSKQDKDGGWGNALDTALATSALLNLGASHGEVEKSIDYILKSKKKNYWPAHAFCIDPAIRGKTYYAGSPALTTAFCIETLGKYKKAHTVQGLPECKMQAGSTRPLKAVGQALNTLSHNKKEKAIYEEINKRAKEKFSGLDEDLKTLALKTLEKTLKKDKKKEITLLPYFFQTSLGETGENMPDHFIASLGLANLYGWMAYTIYDDFLDEEGDPKRLSLANVCLRELTSIFERVSPTEEFGGYFHQTMDKIDSANTWETTHCRGIDLGNIPHYGKYERLYERSMGHALGPVAILSHLGYTQSSREVKSIIKFFEHYIIAKQLNDDAHDWEEDMKRGHINPACALVLKEWKKKRKKSVDMERDLEALQSIFWHKTIVKVCDDALAHIEKARDIIKNIDIVKNKYIFEKILEPLEKSSNKALDEQKKTLEFLKSYK